VENEWYLLVDGRWRSRVGDGLRRYLRYEANAQQVLCEGAGVISPLGVGTLRGSDTRRCLRCKDNTRHGPRRGAGVVDSLCPDSRRGVASCMARLPRLLLLRRGGWRGKPGCSSSATVGSCRRVRRCRASRLSLLLSRCGGEEYHVVAAVKGYELETPEAEQRPQLKRLLEATHLELNGKVFVSTQRAPTWRANYRRFGPARTVNRPVNLLLRVPVQMG
jgi:hypothetical protein